MIPLFLCLYIYMCLVIVGYRRSKRKRQPKFKSWISLSINQLGKRINPSVFIPAMDKIVGQTDFFSLVRQPV